MTQGERIAALETEVRLLKETVNDMDGKLDTLLALRNKGAGAFWLASTLIGTGIIGALTVLIDWVKS